MADNSNKSNNFSTLVTTIADIHHSLAAQAARAVNVSLSLRNWLIGYYVEEYEREGVDRSEYGDQLMAKLAKNLSSQGISRCERRELYRYRQFYLTYPQIVESLTPQFKLDLEKTKTNVIAAKEEEISHINQKDKMSFLEKSHLITKGEELVNKLSFTHLAELINLEDKTQRYFYETECIKGNWSVRELKRQIHSLYYERSGLSTDKKKLTESIQQKAETTNSRLSVRDPYVFEFLGLKSEEVMSESHLEAELIRNLESFLLELGHGFCFEARQKRILIGDEHFFVDLVFYNRILKCHVLIELKLAEFGHENIGQLNTYVSWYQKNMMAEGDNPPIGILLCTHKNHSLMEYALAGMDNQLFVSKYQLELPKKEEMEQFLEEQLKTIGDGNE